MWWAGEGFFFHWVGSRALYFTGRRWSRWHLKNEWGCAGLSEPALSSCRPFKKAVRSLFRVNLKGKKKLWGKARRVQSEQRVSVSPLHRDSLSIHLHLFPFPSGKDAALQSSSLPASDAVYVSTSCILRRCFSWQGGIKREASNITGTTVVFLLFHKEIVQIMPERKRKKKSNWQWLPTGAAETCPVTWRAAHLVPRNQGRT